MIYRTEVWLNNKITVVVGDDLELYEKELARLKELGGVVLAKYAQENELENVIMCSKKGATAVTAAQKNEMCEYPIPMDKLETLLNVAYKDKRAMRIYIGELETENLQLELKICQYENNLNLASSQSQTCESR